MRIYKTLYETDQAYEKPEFSWALAITYTVVLPALITVVARFA